MHQLSQAIAALKSDTITGSQTLLIDQALASARADQIPVADASITYINLQLAHNEVDLTTRMR